MPGMVFALEPKFVFAEGAIGTESTYVMTEAGPECLSITPQIIGYVDLYQTPSMRDTPGRSEQSTLNHQSWTLLDRDE